MNSQPTALVTGAAKRIGRAIALDLARCGWRVAVHYNTSEQEADETAGGASPLDRPGTASPSPVWRVDAAHRPAGHLTRFTLGRNRLAVAAARDADRDAICTRLEHLATFDLREPFGRIREALEEAHKGNRVS